MKNVLKVLFVLSLLLTSLGNVAHADINLTIRDGDIKILEETIPLPPAGTISLSDSGGTLHDIDTDNVLGFLGSIDQTNDKFEISEITDFGFSLYLKCITYSGIEKCDNWQYTVDDSYPDVGMDKTILSGGENVYVYFGPQNRVILSSGNITTDDTLTVTAQKYDYTNNTWLVRTEVTVGLTQPNPDNPFSPIEIMTSPVDGSGQATFSSISADSYSVGVKEDDGFGGYFYFPTESLTVTTPSPSSSSGSRSGGSSRRAKPAPVEEIKAKFDLEKAYEFLIGQQAEDGSFGGDLYTDWVALALAPGNNQTPVLKLIRHFGESKIEGMLLTDYERHAMALMALGLNPHNWSGENYIKKITDSFDGKQFGDMNQDNDDIFALIVLQNAGYGESDPMIKDGISFVLGAQRENGSWDESIDMTGAAIETLSAFSPTPGVGESLEKAKEFLKQSQKDNGGWNNSAPSTAWALQGILALGEKPEDWEKKNKTPADYLATLQDTDGGIKDGNAQNKIWNTAYIASVLSGKTWNQVMQKFAKPTVAETPVKKTTVKTTAVKTKPVNVGVPKKSENASVENTAAAINAAPPSPVPQPETPEKGWLMRLLESIFGPF